MCTTLFFHENRVMSTYVLFYFDLNRRLLNGDRVAQNGGLIVAQNGSLRVAHPRRVAHRRSSDNITGRINVRFADGMSKAGDCHSG